MAGSTDTEETGVVDDKIVTTWEVVVEGAEGFSMGEGIPDVKQK